MNERAYEPEERTSNGGRRRVGSEYEFVTHDLDRAVRRGRNDARADRNGDPAPGGSIPSDTSTLYCERWHGFSDPDELTYGRYVMLQEDAEKVVHGVMNKYDRAAHDFLLGPEWLDALGELFTPLRYPLYGLQQVESYLGVVAPTSTAANAAAFAAADLLRATSVVAQRTRRLQLRHRTRSFAARDRAVWRDLPSWQATRRAVEAAMATSEFGEALTAVNLVLWPVLDSALFRSFGQVARANGDDLTWLLLTSLANDAERNLRWSTALARYAVRERPANEEVFRGWAARWAPRAAEAVEPLAAAIADLPRAMSASDVVDAAAEAVDATLASTRAGA